MQHFALTLHPSGYTEQARGQQFAPLAFDQIGPDDHVDPAGLVFERDEHCALGGAGALAAGNDAGDARPGAVGQVFELARGDVFGQLRAQ